DFIREYLYNRQTVAKPKVNPMASAERMEREVGSILTDNVAAGVMAWAIGALADGSRRGFSNQFLGHANLNRFRDLLASPADAGRAGRAMTTERDFFKALAGAVAQGSAKPADMAQVEAGVLKALSASGDKPKMQAINAVLKRLGQAQNEVKLVEAGVGAGTTAGTQGKKTTMACLNTLVDEARTLAKYASRRKGPFGQAAMDLIGKTNRLNGWRVPLSMAVAVGLSFSVPYLIRQVTTRIQGREYYPAENGLYTRFQEQVLNQGKSSKLFPFLTDSVRNGQMLPTLLTALPLTMGLGLFNIDTLADTASFAKAFNNPLKFNTFTKNLGKMFEFGKSFPFTTRQQMGSLFAFLIIARMMFSRSENEFWERTVDSYTGWGTWIVGMPIIKRALAEAWSPNLLKKVNGADVLRSKQEIGLLPKALRIPTLRSNMVLTLGSLAATLGLMGIVEPYMSIKLSEWRSNRQKRQDAALQARADKFLNPLPGSVSLSRPAKATQAKRVEAEVSVPMPASAPLLQWALPVASPVVPSAVSVLPSQYGAAAQVSSAFPARPEAWPQWQGQVLPAWPPYGMVKP
ncbi:MAG: hypothetical protein KC475_01655, partial [Cyanobacteria bacterium HKST-UBA03]|nr:hypothetical protein [Cyanobacteria bacterium HKST-UBA03]